MLSSIQSRYTVPINSATPTSSDTLRRRPRTISEPPPQKAWLTGNSAHSSPRFQYRLARDRNNAGSLSSAALKNRHPLDFEHENFRAPPDSISNMSSEPDIYNISYQFDIFNNPTGNKREIPASISEEDSRSQKSMLDVIGSSDNSIADVPIHVKLTQLFEPFITRENRAEIEELIADRAETLKDCGIGTEELMRRLKNANAVDTTTAIFFGMLSALGFIVGGQASTRLAPVFKEYLSATSLPYMPGAVVGVVDRLLNSVLTQTHVGFYDRGDPNLLEAVMQENLARFQRSLGDEMNHQAKALTDGYTRRNVVRSVFAPAAAHVGLTEFVDTMLEGLGGLFFSGPYVESLRRQVDRRELLAHPAYLLAQENWTQQLDILQHGPLSRQRIQNLIGRIACKVPDLPQTLFNAFKGLFTANSVTEITLLMTAFACNDWLKECAAETFDDASPEASAFVKNVVGTVGLGFLYYTLGASITFTTAMTTKMQGMMQCTPNKAAAGDAIAVGITPSIRIRNMLLEKATHVERYPRQSV